MTATPGREFSPRRTTKAMALLAVCLALCLPLVSSSDDDAAYYYNTGNIYGGDDDGQWGNNGNGDDNVQYDDKNFYYNNGQGNYNRYYDYQGDDDNAKNGGNGYNYNEAYYNYYNQGGGNGNNNNNNDDGNNNNNNYNNNDDANGNGNNYNYNDDANGGNNNYNNGDDANNNQYYYNYNNDDANGNGNNNNDDGNGNNNNNGENNYYYEALDYDDELYVDDNIDIGVDGFDGVSISPVSCVNYNNGHMIKFEIFETSNSYQCHFGAIGTFVVSVAHFMRAYFNYQAITMGKSFSLPDDVGYLNCIPLKMEKYGFEFSYGDDANEEGDDANGNGNRHRRVEEGEEQEQAILYAKVGCRAKETYSSNAFQLHVYTDEQCTEPYEDGRTDQEHARKGYSINLDEYYAANLDGDDGAIKYTDYPANTLDFSTKVSFKPTFYKCLSCKPKISDSFNKFSGSFYDDLVISTYGMTEAAYGEWLAEQQANQQKDCGDNCQYFTYTTDDQSDDYTVQQVDDAYFNTVDDDFSSVFNYADDYNNNNNDDANNGRQLRISSGEPEPKPLAALVPDQTEFKKYEAEFWNGLDVLSEQQQVQPQEQQPDRSLYENLYGGVDNWNLCEQVYRYGLYCDEDCQALDAFKTNQWSNADIVLLAIMVAFMASMMLLIVAKHKRSTTIIAKQQSFYSANDYDPNFSGLDTKQIPGLPPMAMITIFGAILFTIICLALLNFVNETLVFAVVCCILFFIYMLKITLFSAEKRPVVLASPNHEDVFGFHSADSDYNIRSGRRGFFS